MENVRTLAITTALPFVWTWRILLSLVAEEERQKTWRRVISDSAIRWTFSMLPLSTLGKLSGTTEGNYTIWAKRNKMTTYIENIGENAKLLWVLNEKWGEEIPSRVILYLHGGGFYLPMFEDTPSFWYYVQNELKKSCGLDVGIAILAYTLAPEAQFPVQLRQTVAAMEHLISRRIKPCNVIVTGDSAGGNLTMQVLLHILHPLSGIPKLFESAVEESKLAGAYLMSPWLTLEQESSKGSYEENARWDIVTPAKISEFSSAVMSEIKEDEHGRYVDLCCAPSDWYEGIGSTVKSMLISAGGHECMRDDIIKFGKEMEKANGAGDFDLKLVVDKYGLHDEPLLDFIAKEKKLGELTEMIVSWCRDAFM